MGISFCLMWQIYKDDGVYYNFIYFLVWSLIFYLGLTIFSVPYVAMGYEMSDDFKGTSISHRSMDWAVGMGYSPWL
jgi:GPH family glycoside/pentoside/hexuronide:cation symporter